MPSILGFVARHAGLAGETATIRLAAAAISAERSDVLIIDQHSLDQLFGHAERGYPAEVCGVLLGRYGDGMRLRRVLEVHRAQNLNRERAQDRYELDPADYRRIEEHAERSGLEVVGIYHSHPDHPSRPSETDRQRGVDVWAGMRSWSYVIIEVQRGRVASWRAWVLHDEQFEEEPTEQVERIEPEEELNHGRDS